MNWCDFWVKNSPQIQMILPPRPKVPAFFFEEDMALLEEIHITPVATEFLGVSGPPMEDMATWLKVTLDGVEKMVNSYGIL